MRHIRGIILVMVRGDIRARRRGERRRTRFRQYLIWMVDHEREVREGAEAFKAAFIGIV